MKTLMRPLAALCAAVVLALSLGGCGQAGLTEMDATTYVKGLLDATYLGTFQEDYLALIESDQAAAEQAYQRGMEAESGYFAQYFSMEPLTEETMAQTVALYEEIYAKARYTVCPAVSQQDGSFTVKVLVQPIDMMRRVGQAFEQFYQEFTDKYKTADSKALSAQAQHAWTEECAAAYTQGILQLCKDAAAELGYLEEVSLVVQVQKDEDTGRYTISDSDFANLDAQIIAYE